MHFDIVENESLSRQGRMYAEYRLFAALSPAASAVARVSLVLHRHTGRRFGGVVCTVTVESTDGRVTLVRAAGNHPYAAINRAVERIRRRFETCGSRSCRPA